MELNDNGPHTDGRRSIHDQRSDDPDILSAPVVAAFFRSYMFLSGTDTFRKTVYPERNPFREVLRAYPLPAEFAQRRHRGRFFAAAN